MHAPCMLRTSGLGESVDAGFLVGDGGTEPDLDVVEGVIDLAHLKAVDVVERSSDLVDGPGQHALAHVQRPLGQLVRLGLLVERRVFNGHLDLGHGGVEGGLYKIFRFSAVGLCQALQARFLEPGVAAERLDFFRRLFTVGGHRGDHGRHHEDGGQPGSRRSLIVSVSHLLWLLLILLNLFIC